ncbi:hypothetical protein WI99_09735 [Burkholderia cepacia]|uniref:hypothetical protein n=1 Tax=Burkholderia cepacia TaxID=292 RepID=UPI000759C2B3|nr:hypothetical protein [Burkholderia cepacia]KVE89136.1 hypothetical protein WI99_09735 [Burkholderia cepacia]
MADIELIESRLAEARQQAATAQRELEERMLENNGAEDAETAQLRSIVDTHRSREATLIQVRKAAYAANSAAALAARAEAARDGVREAAKLERQFVKAAAALDVALAALLVARSEFMQVEEELRSVSVRKVLLNVGTHNSDYFNVSNSCIATDLLRRHIRHVFDEERVQQPLADEARRYHARTMRVLESVVNRPAPSVSRSPYGSAAGAELTSHSALHAGGEEA